MVEATEPVRDNDCVGFAPRCVLPARRGHARCASPGVSLTLPTGWQIPDLFAIYGLGFTAVPAVLALFYAHAHRQREALELSPVEVFLTRAGVQEHGVAASIGLLSIGVALAVRPEHAGVAGLIYFLLAPAMTVNGVMIGRARHRRFGPGPVLPE